MIIWDMTLLAMDTLLTLWGAIFIACLIAFFGMLWSIWGPVWVLRAMTGLLFCTLIFILSQAGRSAWGASMMLYLMPAAIGIVSSAVIALCLGWTGMIRRLR
ncbi:MAG: hypothetical protein AAF526_06925 [Pseudomonadota bacterium]